VATGLTGATSETITVTVATPVPSKLGILTQPPETATSGVTFSRAPVVELEDVNGNAVAIAGVSVSVTIASGTGSLGGTTTVNTDALGRATFSDLAITGTAGSYTLQFSSTGLTPVTSTAIVLSAGPASQLSITTQPSATATQNVAFARQPVIQLRDSGGNPVNQAGVTVTAELASGTGTLAGDKTPTTDASGVATFTNLKIQSVGTYTLRFTSGTLTSVVSSAIVVGP
jgi:hypothetical protein